MVGIKRLKYFLFIREKEQTGEQLSSKDVVIKLAANPSRSETRNNILMLHCGSQKRIAICFMDSACRALQLDWICPGNYSSK